jgi:hypothetical protein
MMALMRKIKHGNLTMEAPFFVELLTSENSDTARLSSDHEAHALWHYLGAASTALRAAQNNFVYEDDRSLIFTKETARALFIAIANVHQVEPGKMVKFWDMIDRQRVALGAGSEDLPAEMKFKYWGH